MGKTKKKVPATVVTEASASNTGDDPPPKRKRGRPRKVTKEAVKPEEQDAHVDSKKLKAFSEDATEGTQTESSPAISEKTHGDVKASADFEPPKPKPAIRREGSRRKSEPRRAAESSLVGR